MTAPNKFSLILMHDDGKPHRLRISKRTFYLCIVIMVLLPLLGSTGIWVGWKTWQDRSRWEDIRLAMQTRLDEAHVRLERLSNMQALYNMQSGVPVALPPVLPAASASSSSHEPERPAPNATQTASPAVANNATMAADSPAMQPASASPELAEAAAGPPDSAKSTPDESPAMINKGLVRIENVSARMIDRNRLRMSVDLYNATPNGQALSGRTVFTMLSADGQPHQLPAEDAMFKISRFKKIVSTNPLPAGLGDTEDAVIMVEVVVDGKIIFRNIYPVESR